MTAKTTSTRYGSFRIERGSTPKRTGWYSAPLWLGMGWILVGGFGIVAPSAPYVVFGLGVILLLVSSTRRFVSSPPQGLSDVPKATARQSAVAASTRIRPSNPRAKVTLLERSVPVARSAETPDPSGLGPPRVVPSQQREFEEKTGTLIEAVKSAILTAKDRETKPRTEKNEVSSRLVTLEQMARRLEMVALNAAIEAARAKEHGSGFSIVAKEVRVIAEKLRTQIAASIALFGATESEEAAGGWVTRVLSATLDGLNGLKADFEKDDSAGRPSTQTAVLKGPTLMKAQGTAEPIRLVETNARTLVNPGRLLRLGASGSMEQPKRGLEKSNVLDGERVLLESKRVGVGAKTARPRTQRPMPLVRLTSSKERGAKPLFRSEASAPKGLARSPGVKGPAANATAARAIPTKPETQTIESTKSETTNLEGGRDAEDSQFERF